jgi:hypothetical protein
VRACKIGTVMFGMRPDGTAMDLVRLAIPRRTYTQSHSDYVIEVANAWPTGRPGCPACVSCRSPGSDATSPHGSRRCADHRPVRA